MSFPKILLGLLLVLTACGPTNTPSVAVTVHVVDADTGQPLPEADALLVSIYARNGMGAANGDSLHYASADGQGVVQATFSQAFLVAAAAQVPGYWPARAKLQVQQPGVTLILPLRPIQPNPTLQSKLYYSALINADEAFHSLWLPDSVLEQHREPVVLKVDFCPQQSGERFEDSYGLRLAGNRISRDTAVCDVWLAQPQAGQPPTVLVAGGRGGICPFFTQEYTHSTLLEPAQAPAHGYQARYVLTGKEAGFFIRTRDGRHYGKYVFGQAGGPLLSGAPGLGEPMCRYWWEGSCLYQPDRSRNLALPLARVNLLSFLKGSIP